MNSKEGFELHIIMKHNVKHFIYYLLYIQDKDERFISLSP